MFIKIAGFEFRYQVKQPIFWVAVILFALLSFGLVASGNIQLGSNANVHKNAAYAIAQAHQFFAILYMFITTAFVANVVIRDDDTGFAPIIRSTRVNKFDYLYGRFLGAFGAAALSFLAVPIGMLLGSRMPWVDPETLGPLVLGDYLYAYFFIALPVLLVTSALFFAFATITRSMMWTYVGVIGLLVLRGAFTVIASRQGYERIAALWEPFGSGAFTLATRYYTAAERNSMMPPIEGELLWNKVIWFGISLAVLGLAYFLFNFAPGQLRGKRGKAARLAAKADAEAAPSAPVRALPKPVFNAHTARSQLWARTKLDAGQVFRSPAFFVLLALGALLSVVNLWFSTDLSLYGGRVFPVTRVAINALNGTFTAVSSIIATYYAGELVWREREKKTHEIIDATAIPDWAFLFPKTLAIALVLISTTLVSVAVAVTIQTFKGFTDYEFGKYLLWFVLPSSIDMILIAVLAIFIQALSPHKFVGWGVMVIYIISTIVLGNLGFEHNLYNYGGSPTVPLSDMNGQGHYWVGAYWFRLYWSAFAVLLLILAYGLWRRGTETRLMPRLRRLPSRLKGGAGIALGLALAVFVGSGTWIYLNTNVWNPYRTHLDDERWTADLEKALLRYEDTPQPKIVDEKLEVDIRPHEPRITTRGVYVIENKTAQPLREVHVRFPRDLEMRSLAIQGARPIKTYDEFNYRIFAFDTPMQPGERRTMAFETVLKQRGFKNSGPLTSVVDNGTFVNDREITPGLGMDRDGLLQDRALRRKHHLPPELRMPKLGAPGADQYNLLGRDSDWVTADIKVTTEADQTPIAPGYKVSETVNGGRRTAEFRTEAPILRFFSIQSARYAVKTQVYKGVAISIYYNPEHPWNVDRMIKGMETGLDYYQANFSPYQFRQVRVLEFPSFQGAFAESFANTIPWSEGLVFIADNRDPEKIDMVTYVGAHELGHQWWAHQVIGAKEQGVTLLDETLAQYSALMVMKHMYGPDMIRKFLKYELDSYLKARGGEVVEELPLSRVENQGYIHYRKGSLVMYRLQDEIGEAAVNRALRAFLAKFAFKGAPYSTSTDLLTLIRAEAPADKQQLITDLFERITLYDNKTTAAVAHKRPDGRYDVTLTISARKLYADAHGKETEAPLDEYIDVGVFAVEPGKAGFGADDVLAMQRVRVHSGVQTVRLVVSARTVDRLAPASPFGGQAGGRRTVTLSPLWAGVDPYNKIIDRNSGDNLMRIGAN